MTPVKSGLLDEAVLKLNDSIWAVDFNECPLGNAFFDLYPALFSANRKYKDVFHGMIYYMHPKDFLRISGYNYMLNNFKDTLLRRLSVSGDPNPQATIDRWEQRPEYSEISSITKLFNLVFLCLHYIILLFLLLNACIILLQQQKHMKPLHE
jgi:hypothetical protein